MRCDSSSTVKTNDEEQYRIMTLICLAEEFAASSSPRRLIWPQAACESEETGSILILSAAATFLLEKCRNFVNGRFEAMKHVGRSQRSAASPYKHFVQCNSGPIFVLGQCNEWGRMQSIAQLVTGAAVSSCRWLFRRRCRWSCWRRGASHYDR